MALQQVHEDLWVLAAPLSMFGLHLGTRMTVVRLPSGGLWLHSPVPLNEALLDELRALGNVEHIVAPNLYHHLHAGTASAAFPDAALHARPKLRKKRKDLHIHADLCGTADPAWGDVFENVPIGGNMLDEVVFFHRPSGHLISCDLVENFGGCDHFVTRMYLKAAGIYHKPGFSRFLRPMFRQRAEARASIDRLLALDFGGIVLSHGDPIAEGGPDILRDSYVWLKG